MPRPPGLGHYTMQGIIAAQARFHVEEIRGVITMIRWADEDRAEPQASGAQVSDVIHFFRQPFQRAAADPEQITSPGPITPVAGIETIDEDLVDHCLTRPGRRPIMIYTIRESVLASAIAGRCFRDRLAAESKRQQSALQ